MKFNCADYNAFGYDPKGCLAAIAAYFYGPAWKPVDGPDIPTPIQRHTIRPPRYGPPAPWQIPSLPWDFVARLPPCYLGRPDGYLPGPDTFKTANFSALFLTLRDRPTPTRSLEVQYGRRILEGLPVGEVKDEVFWVPVYYVFESQRLEFCILTDINWNAFHGMVCTHLGVDATHAQLAYRLYTDGYSKADGLTRLVNKKDWRKAMIDVGKEFVHSNDVEVEILDVNNARPKGNAKNLSYLQNTDLGAEDLYLLSSSAPDIDTYAFFYPSVLLDLRDEGLTQKEVELVQGAGVNNADDITFLSPLNLCLTTGIAPAKIVAVYRWANEMIAKVHEEQRELIAELKSLRKFSN